MAMDLIKTKEDVTNALQDLEDAFFDIPFENSQFQNENFIINAQLTPERAYRSIGLRLSARIRALNEAYFGRQTEDIDIAELQEKITLESTSKWDKQRFEIEIQKKLSNRTYTDKLINDAIKEVNYLYGVFKKYPRYTSEQFELGEAKHFEQKLTRAAQGISGPLESLANMTDDAKALPQLIEQQLLQLEYQPNK